MDRIAKETGATSTDAAETNPRHFFHDIAEELRNSYELAYCPTDSTRDGSFRKIRIEPLSEGMTMSSRTGYFAANPEWNEFPTQNSSSRPYPRLVISTEAVRPGSPANELVRWVRQHGAVERPPHFALALTGTDPAHANRTAHGKATAHSSNAVAFQSQSSKLMHHRKN